MVQNCPGEVAAAGEAVVGPCQVAPAMEIYQVVEVGAAVEVAVASHLPPAVTLVPAVLLPPQRAEAVMQLALQQVIGWCLLKGALQVLCTLCALEPAWLLVAAR